MNDKKKMLEERDAKDRATMERAGKIIDKLLYGSIGALIGMLVMILRNSF